MVLDVVGSNPTIYPLLYSKKFNLKKFLKNPKNKFKLDKVEKLSLVLRKNLNKKLVPYIGSFLVKDLRFRKKIKVNYFKLYQKTFRLDSKGFLKTKNLNYIFINLKKKNPVCSILTKKLKVFDSFSVGSVLKKLKIKKSKKRKLSGFNFFVKILSKFTLINSKKFNKNYIVRIMGSDAKIFKNKLVILKKLKKIQYVFFNLRLGFGTRKLKKFGSIKKRVKRLVFNRKLKILKNSDIFFKGGLN